VSTVRLQHPTTAAPQLEAVTASGVVWRLGRWRDGPAGGVGAPDANGLRRRRELARDWARELVTHRLGRDWPGFAPDAPGRKPRLHGEPGIDVSISHGATALLVAAVAGGGRLGVDVEDEPFDAFRRDALVRRMCSPAERAAFDRLPESLRLRALARAWTIKEATLKARGVGLAEDPRGVPVDPGGLGLGPGDAGPHEGGPEYAIVHLTGGAAVIRHRGD
jgi:hypothetical protein